MISKVAIVSILSFFVALSAYRYTLFTPPPRPAYPATRPFPGNGYESVDPGRYDVTNLVNELSLPTSLDLSADNRTLIITQATGEVLLFSRDSAGSFTVGPRLHPGPPPPILTGVSRPDVSPYIRHRPDSLQDDYTSQIAASLTDPRTAQIYFIDHLDGRLYRILPLPSH